MKSVFDHSMSTIPIIPSFILFSFSCSYLLKMMSNFSVIIDLKTSISSFYSLDLSFSFVSRVFIIDLLAVVMCFIVNLFRQVVVLSMINLFISFRVGSSIRHSHPLTCCSNLIIFNINLDTVSFSKDF